MLHTKYSIRGMVSWPQSFMLYFLYSTRGSALTNAYKRRIVWKTSLYNQPRHYGKYRMFNRQSACPSYQIKSGCVAWSLHFVLFLAFWTLSKQRIMVLISDHNILGMVYKALHLPFWVSISFVLYQILLLLSCSSLMSTLETNQPHVYTSNTLANILLSPHHLAHHTWLGLLEIS